MRAVVTQLRLEAQVEHVDDLEQIVRFGLLALPGLAVDGQVIASGYPGRRRVEQQLREARVSVDNTGPNGGDSDANLPLRV